MSYRNCMTMTKTSSYKIISCTKCFWLIPGTSKPISTCGNMNNCHITTILKLSCCWTCTNQIRQLPASNNCMVAEHFNKPSETKAHTTTIIPGPCPLPTNPPTLAPCAVPANHTAPAPFAVPDNPTALSTYAVPAIPSAAAPCAVPARPAPVGTMFTLKSLIPLTSTPETILQSPMLLQIELFLIPDT